MNYEAIVGLEIHIQAKTRSKMFSAVSAEYFNRPPNTCVDPVTLGLPGALPVPNKKAIELAISLAMALNCDINKNTKFDRKNYFYPDLPKGYQISQFDKPIGEGGYIEARLDNGQMKKFELTRLHLEEDTGKSIHEGNKTLIDFNKAGVPLIEIVTEPVFRNVDEILNFAKSLRQIVRYTNVSDGDMEKGQMRYELNMSLRPVGQSDLPNYKVEVKNIGSISLLEKVFEFEFNRQKGILETGNVPPQETRGAIDMTGKTKSQRIKEDSDDYRYFPEPDIPPLNFSDEYLKSIRDNLPLLPNQIIEKLSSLKLNQEIIDIILGDKEIANYLVKFADNNSNETSRELAKLLASDLKQLLDEHGMSILTKEGIDDQLKKVIELKLADEINSTTMTELLGKVVTNSFKNPQEIEHYISENNLKQDNDSSELEKIVTDIVSQDSTAKDRFAKNQNVAMFFVGQVMKETRGSANPKLVKELVIKELSN